MEKTISGHGQVVKMICTRLPDCTFTKLHSPCNHHIAMMSKKTVYASRSELRPTLHYSSKMVSVEPIISDPAPGNQVFNVEIITLEN
jgi:hypothetical protein